MTKEQFKDWLYSTLDRGVSEGWLNLLEARWLRWKIPSEIAISCGSGSKAVEAREYFVRNLEHNAKFGYTKDEYSYVI